MLGDIRQAKNVYIVCGYPDMRKSINSLVPYIQQNFQMDPYSSGLFLFCGKRCDRLKALLWEPDGFVLLYKKLSNGRYQWPRVDYYVATYKCAACETTTGKTHIVQAKAPVPVMKKSMAAPSTVAYVMAEKFEKGVPLYRQESYWKSQGIQLQRNTMGNWIIRGSRWFEPLWKLLRQELLACDVVNADETRCHVLKEDGRESSQMSQMWVFCAPEKNIALYQYKPSRGGKVAKEMLENFSAICKPTAIRRTMR